MSQSVVFQAYSDTGSFGVDWAILAAAVIKVLRRQGVEAYVKNEGLEGVAYADEYDVPEASALEEAEVVLRAWPPGNWPARPVGPRTVVDFVQHPADRSGDADFVVAFEADDTPEFPGLIVWNVLYPLPIEVNEQAQTKSIVPGVVVIHLGQDVLSRLPGIVSAIHGYNGMTAVGLRYPDASDGPGITATAFPWDFMASGDVAIVTHEFPFRLAAAMRIPAILFEMVSGETRVEELTGRGHSSFFQMGFLSGYTNNQVRDAAYDLVNDDIAKRVARLGGSEMRADHGVKRFADWVGRELIGRSIIEADPYNIQGFDTVFDAHTMIPLNAQGQVADQGGSSTNDPLEEEVQVEIFTADGTWTKPDGAKFVNVRLIGAGGGGGSGRRGAAGSVRGGGGGGGGGIAAEATFPAVSLPPTVAVTVGVGGLGGIGQNLNDNDGNPGNFGGDTMFGDFLGGAGSDGGQPGGVLGGTGGAPLFSDPWNFSHLTSDSGFSTNNSEGGAGGVGGGVGGVNGGHGAIASAGGGGGGGGFDAANIGELGGGGGNGSQQRGAGVFIAGSGGNPDGGSGESAETGNVQGGAGAGGGSSNVPLVFGMGGAGGFPGGGGGGGSASLNGTDSGAGGQGANGLVVVTTFF